ncbi:unnamed protein product [Eruca vesicaria subsp. sativa]|uniref:Uncharacterized protein n=1 Tax=Eruca vesicaria subsp. sativa TaxID=29727 RepID=A0ABC8K3U2_ERUVS|nr:unnamed protein product [Eruca vesicaria subsp. sativa]
MAVLSWLNGMQTVRSFGQNSSTMTSQFSWTEASTYHCSAMIMHMKLFWFTGCEFLRRICYLQFAGRALFYNTQTQPLSRVEVVEKNVKLGTVTLGTHTNMFSNPSSTKFDRASRVSFKYSTSRGVYRIPTFYVNGFILPDAGSPLDFGGWKSVLDALVQTTQSRDAKWFYFFF